MRVRPLLLLVALPACATSEPASVGLPPTRPASISATSTSVDVSLPPDREIVAESVRATPPVAWAALLKAYEDLGIEVKEVNERLRILGNPRFVVSRRLAGTPLSRYLDCGAGIQGHFADTRRIEIWIRSSIAPGDPDGSEVSTYLEAVARNPEGTSNTAVACSSSRLLEREIAARVRFHAEGG